MQESIFLIILIVVLTLVLIGLNFYLLRLYVHKDDKGFTKALFYKILVILGLALCQAQALMVPLDVANLSAIQQSFLKMSNFWSFLYIIVLGFICILLPYAIFLYQTDDQDPIYKRLLAALCFTGISLVISAMILLISWNFFKFVDIPCEQVSLTVSQIYNGKLLTPQKQQTIFESQTTFYVYVIAILSFFGWILLVMFGGIGLFALPFDIINEFRKRPKARKKQEMEKTRQQIVQMIKQLIEEGDQLEQTGLVLQKNQQAGFCEKFRSKRKVHSGMNIFKAKYFQLNTQYEIFNLQLKLANANPIVPILKLILGIIFLITTILWLIQIIFGNIVKAFTGDRPLIYMFNELFIKLEQSNAGFISTFIFSYLALYMLWCVQKGNIKFGMQIPFLCRLHPLKQHETWMNSFLFNVILILISSVGIVQLCISSFPTYTRNSEIYMIFGVQVYNLHFYRVFYQNNVFPIAIVCWSFLSLVYLLVTCNRKPKYMKKIEQIRKKNQDDFQID